MLKLEAPRESRLYKSVNSKNRVSSFDCLALYTHSDHSFDWLPCKIVSRKLRGDLSKLQNVTFNAFCFEYQVSFLHLAQKQDAYD